MGPTQMWGLGRNQSLARSLPPSSFKEPLHCSPPPEPAKVFSRLSLEEPQRQFPCPKFLL